MFITYQRNIENTIEMLKHVVNDQVKGFIENSRKEEINNYTKMSEYLIKYNDSVEEAMNNKKKYFKKLKQVEEESLRKVKEAEINQGTFEEMYGNVSYENNIQLGREAQKNYQQSITNSNEAKQFLLSKAPEAMKLYKEFNNTMINTLIGMGRMFSFHLQKEVKAENEIFTKSNDKINAIDIESLNKGNCDYEIKAPDELTFQPYKIQLLDGGSLDYSIKHCKFYNKTIVNAVIEIKDHFPDLAPDVNIYIYILV